MPHSFRVHTLFLVLTAPAFINAFLAPSHGFLASQGMVSARSKRLVCSSAIPAKAAGTRRRGSTPAPTSAPTRCPVEKENELFACGPSVEKWGEGQMKGIAAWNPPEPQIQLAEGLTAAVQKFVNSLQRSLSQAKSNRDRLYWGYHVARASFFAGLGIAGYTAATIAGRSQGISGSGLVSTNGTTGSLANTAANYAFRFDESLLTFEQDLANIKNGFYKMPWDMEMGFSHRQVRPTYWISKAGLLVREASSILQRSWRQKDEDKNVWFFTDQNGRSGESIYPDYYRNNFHYQTDGWMSDTSAAVYEASTETIFMGRQDCMQRTALIPVTSWMKDRGLHSQEGRGVTSLEVACGTGRFNTFMRDNWPLMAGTVTDLSPFYLAEARRNSEYWEKARRKDKPVGKATFAQANAEDLAQFADNTFDIVVCMYMFHEMPTPARERAAREMARVCKPGGLVVLCDSVQIGDRVGMGESMHLFTRLNEPHYSTYLNEDLPRLFTDVGLMPVRVQQIQDEKHLCSTTKVLSFRKGESDVWRDYSYV